MWFTLRREGVEFIDRARSVHVAEATMTAPRACVFDRPAARSKTRAGCRAD